MATSRLCSIPNCDKVHYGKDLCKMHYLRVYRGGDATYTYRNKADRFLDEAMSSDTDDCIIWPYARNASGYGIIRSRIASRVMCEKVNGPPPSNSHQAAHSCGNGHLGCINGHHLRWATRSENQKDRTAHGTDSRGERCGRARLKEDQVRSIYNIRGTEPITTTASRYGVGETTIRHIQRQVTWKCLNLD